MSIASSSSQSPIAAAGAAVALAIAAIGAGWLFSRGMGIVAAAAIERPEDSIIGMLMVGLGAVVIGLGVIAALLALVPGLALLSYVLAIALALMVLGLASRATQQLIGRESPVQREVSHIRDMVGTILIVIAIFAGLAVLGEMAIPLMAGIMMQALEIPWALLFGALTMVGSAFAAAIAIIAAVTSGSRLIAERPEAAIWALLFVALGEGIAIYGLIVAILMVVG